MSAMFLPSFYQQIFSSKSPRLGIACFWLEMYVCGLDWWPVTALAGRCVLWWMETTATPCMHLFVVCSLISYRELIVPHILSSVILTGRQKKISSRGRSVTNGRRTGLSHRDVDECVKVCWVQRGSSGTSGHPILLQQVLPLPRF